MIKLVFVLLLAVGYSLQSPVEVEDLTEVEPETTSPEPEDPEFYPNGECPETDGELPVYLTDLKNCSVFYQCANGVPYMMTCTYPLEFNPNLLVCDFPGSSGCIVDKIQPYRMIGRCPPKSRPGMTKLLRDSEDKTIYYECVDGEPVLRKCPEDTFFNFVKKSCLPVE